jgi:toxin FitB
VILLDTNVVSEAQRPGGAPRVREALARHRRETCLSVIVLAELLFGVERLSDGARKTAILGNYARMRRALGHRIYPVSEEVGATWARLRARRQAAGRPLAMADGLIAATALVHDLTLWTRNTRDFEGTGVRLFDPWED